MLSNILTQKQSLRQEQTISARQLQSLELLHAPILELQEQLAQELAANPVLEVENVAQEITVGDPLGGGNEPDPVGDEDDMSALYSAGDEWHDELPLPGEQSFGDAEGREHFFNSLTSEQSMADLLLEELRMADTDPMTAKVAELIIGSLDERGFLQTHPADIAMALDVSMEEVEQALMLVQSFDPPGIGARSLQECLRLQLERRGENDPRLMELIERHLEDLARNRLPQVAREMKISVPELDGLLARLRTLNPSPGSVYAQPDGEFVSPEVTIEREAGGRYVVAPASHLPRLHIPERYFRMLEDQSLSAEDRTYIREKIAAARELIRSLELRNTTIRRIAALIAEGQHDFLENGVEFLKPMTMRQAADKLELHETTVSRAIAGKYVQTPRGIFAFRYFFTGGFVTNEGTAVSSRSVQERIRQLVAEEDSAKPLSDEKISKLLAAEGIELARRTVAKYRDELGIPGTSMRRVHR